MHLGDLRREGIRLRAATYMLVPWPWHLAIEALYIREYEPSRNAQHVDP